MKITAAVLRSHDGPHHLEQVELAEPGADDALVRIVGTGLCHSDLLPRVPGITAGPPFIVGHEGAGVVEKIGSAVTDVTVGDHVVLSFDYCRTCESCLTGRPAYCSAFNERNLLGLSDGDSPVHDQDGQPVHARWFGQSSAATHALVHSGNVVVVDRDLPLELLGPLGCGIQTGAGAVLDGLSVTAGSSIVVFGTGAVGLSAIIAAAAAGATTIVGVDVNLSRLALARKLGATHAFESSTPGLAERVIDATRGGAHFTLDTTGIPAVINTAIDVLAGTGTCGLLGVQKGDLTIGPATLVTGRAVRGLRMGGVPPRVLIPRLLDLYRQGRFPFGELITTFPLTEINEAEQAAVRGDVIKPVLLPSL